MARRQDAQEKARLKQAEHERRKQAEREARREAARASSLAGSAEAAARREARGAAPAAAASEPTFGERIARDGLLEKISAATRGIIERTAAKADEHGRVSLKVVSCVGCTAPKGCCKLLTGIYLYEAVPIAARLIREGRDTAALRAQLAAAADAMERGRRDSYRRPCVFLDEAERCTVYEDRPSQCGAALVFSDPASCSSTDPAVRVEAFGSAAEEGLPPRLEERFLLDVGLRRTDHVYIGALPRMVLLALEAWDRRDYVELLAERGRPAARWFARAVGAGA